MRDERIRRNTCQNFRRKTPSFVTSEQCRVLVPSFRGLRMKRLGPWPPFWRGKRLHFLTRATEARVINPFRRLVCRLLMSAAERLSEKRTFGREAKLRGQLWNFDDNLPASQKGVYLFYNPPINFHLAIKPLVNLVNARDLRVEVKCVSKVN